MSLKPEASIGTGLAVAALVIAVYSRAVPSAADVRVGSRDDDDIDAARKGAAWTAAGAVAAISLIAKDATVFVIGGGMVVAIDWWTRHANTNDPALTHFLPSLSSNDQPQATDDMDVTNVTGLAA